MNLKRILSVMLVLAITVAFFTGCGEKKEKILIYTSAEDYVVEDMQLALDEKFPQYDIIVEYLSTGDHAAKLIAEGENTDCDISYQLEYPYIEKLDAQNGLADLTDIIDASVFEAETIVSKNFVPQYRSGGAIILNTDLLKEKKLSEPTSYADLLKSEYKDLISMPNPKSSGTGYMFLLSLVNAMGEDEAFKYFDDLSKNVLQFTSSGSGPVNALLQGEAAIGLGMTGQAVVKMNEVDAPFKVVYFAEGSPFTLYGQGIIKGKEERESVVEVFKYLSVEYTEECCSKFYPEKIFKGKDFTIENFPKDITYADMKNNTSEEKERLLAKWKY